MAKADVDQIWVTVKANLEKLKSCPGPHDFRAMYPGRTFNQRYRCEKCGGEIGPTEQIWYQRGLEHGKQG